MQTALRRLPIVACGAAVLIRCDISECESRRLWVPWQSKKPVEEAVQQSPSARTQRKDSMPSLVIFSGGTAVNSFAAELAHRNEHTTHVLPVSDDGGSTKAIIDVLGGTAVGDIRSRCLKLAEGMAEESEATAVSRLLGKRLSKDPAEARRQWHLILAGNEEPGKSLWKDIGGAYHDTIRAFLLHFDHEVQRRCSPGREPFDFSNGSVGNFFFAGARLFYRSLDAAIFTYCRVSGISHKSLVLPIIRSDGERQLVMGTKLADGSFIVGQNNLSHPPQPGASTVVCTHQGWSNPGPTLPLRLTRLLPGR